MLKFYLQSNEAASAPVRTRVFIFKTLKQLLVLSDAKILLASTQACGANA